MEQSHEWNWEMGNHALSMVLTDELTTYLNVVKEGEFQVPFALVYYRWTWICEEVVYGLAMIPGVPKLSFFEIPRDEFFDNIDYQTLPFSS